MHGRGDDYRELRPRRCCLLRLGCVEVDLSGVKKPMIALPFPSFSRVDEARESRGHPSGGTQGRQIRRTKTHFSLLDKIVDGKLHVQQGVIAGCSGGNYGSWSGCPRAQRRQHLGCGEFRCRSILRASPWHSKLAPQLYLRPYGGQRDCAAFCGPCFGAGDTPANNGLSIRHTTRNFPNREGSKPGNGQLSAVALMDARSITAAAKRRLRQRPTYRGLWDEACGPHL